MGRRKSKERKRMTFLDLPPTVRDKVYRALFLFSESVTWEIHLAFCERNASYCMHWKPKVACVSRKIGEEVARVYFEENRFYIKNTHTLGAFLRSITPKQAQAIRSLTFDYEGKGATEAFQCLKKAKGLLNLRIGVNEIQMVQEFCRAENGFRYEAAREMTPQLNMKVLLHAGIDTLRTFRGIPNVSFQALRSDKSSGPVSGGIFESEIAPEMMRQPDLEHFESDASDHEASYFPFLRLAPELRNRIYKFLLLIPGPVNPSTRLPTSSTVCGSGAKSGLSRPGPTRSSALAILQTNRQIRDEAIGLFYSSNHFVFYFPLQLCGFLHAISNKRQSFIREITIWYKNAVEGGINTIDVPLGMLCSLPSLRQLHLIFDEWPGTKYNKTFQPNFAGKNTLRRLRGLEDFTIRNLDFEQRLSLIGGSLEDQPEDNMSRKEFRRVYRRMKECEAEIKKEVTMP